MMISIPYLKDIPGGKQLYVKDEPFLMRAAELQNSSLSSATFMQSVWPKMKGAHINTLLGAVSWDQVEPVEGQFDFAQLDQVILDARANDMHLILLWFGSFKNALSTYVPGWVKSDAQRFPRAKLRKSGGKLITADLISVFDKNDNGVTADAKAFRKVMEHLREVDEKHSTVVMVQVENEVGILGDSRDGSELADAAFASPVPEDLLEYISRDHDKFHSSLLSNLKHFQAGPKTGSWPEVFGNSPQTDEIFMAYHYAKYVEKVASAGKNTYGLPLYTNVWQNYSGEDGENDFPALVGGGGEPGDYPSGGGTITTLDIWMDFAPSLSMIAPDIYLTNYERTCKQYQHRGQALLIPEQRRDEYGARRIWSALGSYQCLGTAPFGIDTLEVDENAFGKHYKLVQQTAALILKAQQNPGTSVGFFFDELRSDGTDPSPAREVQFGDTILRVERCFVFGKPGPGFGMIIHEGGAKFLLIGEGFQVKFRSTKPGATFTGILAFHELEVADVKTGALRQLRHLGGDETRSGEAALMPNEKPDYGDFPISVTIPAKTRIARVESYSIFE